MGWVSALLFALWLMLIGFILLLGFGVASERDNTPPTASRKGLSSEE